MGVPQYVLRVLALCSLLALGLALGCSGSEPGPSPDSGIVVTEFCEPPLILCGGACVNTENDPSHCGRCDSTCEAMSFCDLGACKTICSQGLEACGGSCADLSNDEKHCGACGRMCPADRMCVNGGCACPAGTVDCAGACVDPNTDNSNCGICGRQCAAQEACQSGSCACVSGDREINCTDGMDDDCDQLVDCADPDCEGTTRSCSGACGPGAETCQIDGQWGTCQGGSGEAEICGDGIDQDCDGSDLVMPDQWEPNDSCASCRLVSPDVDPNVFVNARFDTVDDRLDCFKFNADDGASYQEHILITLEDIPAGHDYDIYLHDSEANCTARTALARSNAVGDGDEMIDWGERFGSNDDGTYFVRVVRFAGNSCTEDYKLTINGMR